MNWAARDDSLELFTVCWARRGIEVEGAFFDAAAAGWEVRWLVEGQLSGSTTGGPHYCCSSTVLYFSP